MKRFNQKIAMIAVAALCCVEARAATSVTFPSAGGDLSSDAAWGGSKPASDDLVTIASNGTYTAASSDLAYGSLSVVATNVTFDFSATPSRRVVFDGSVENALTVNKAKSQTFFKGGEWAVADGKNCKFCCGTGAYATRVHDHDVFLDSCVWTNLNRVYIGQGESRCRMIMDNASRIYAGQCFVVNGSLTGNQLFVFGGSAMHLSDSSNPFYSDNGNAPSSDTGKIVVSGMGSLISAPTGIFQIGNSHPDIQLYVTNKASLAAGQFMVGRTATAVRCRAFVADGASLTANTSIQVMGTDASMVVSNATLTVTAAATDALTVGYGGCNGQSFVLSGGDTTLGFSPNNWCDVFAAKAQSAEFRIENGAAWNAPNPVRFAVNATNCVFRIDRGGEFSLNDGLTTMEFGPGSSSATAVLSVSNRIEVCDGGKLRLKELRLDGIGNSLVVSNASVVYKGSDTGNLRIGYKGPKWSAEVFPTNCAFVLRGKTAKVDAQKAEINLFHGSTLRIEVPEDGYANGFVPLDIRSITSDGNGNKIEIDCEKFAEKTGGKLTLATVSYNTGLTFANTVAMLEETARNLPEGCTLTWADKKLVLKSPRKTGILLIVW